MYVIPVCGEQISVHEPTPERQSAVRDHVMRRFQELELTRKLRAIELIACESVCKEGFLRRCDVKAIMRNGRVVLQIRGEVAGDRWTADHVSEVSTSGEIA